MSKVVITIEDVDDGAGINAVASFDPPILDPLPPGTLPPSHVLALKLLVVVKMHDDNFGADDDDDDDDEGGA